MTTHDPDLGRLREQTRRGVRSSSAVRPGQNYEARSPTAPAAPRPSTGSGAGGRWVFVIFLCIIGWSYFSSATNRPARPPTPQVPSTTSYKSPPPVPSPRPSDLATSRSPMIVTPVPPPRPSDVTTSRPPIVPSPRPSDVVIPRPPLMEWPTPVPGTSDVVTSRPPMIITPAPPPRPSDVVGSWPPIIPPSTPVDDAFTLTACNRSSLSASVAVMGRPLPAPSDWVVHGWSNVGPGECAAIGRYLKGDIYVTAMGPNGERWGRPDISLCVSMDEFWRVHSAGYMCASNERLLPFKRMHIDGDNYTMSLY
jgi:uncharacterized membrane protein